MIMNIFCSSVTMCASSGNQGPPFRGQQSGRSRQGPGPRDPWAPREGYWAQFAIVETFKGSEKGGEEGRCGCSLFEGIVNA